MAKKRKIKLSFIFVTVLSATLILLAAVLALVFVNSIKEFGEYTTEVNQNKIHDQAIYLLQKNVSSTAQYYSAIFNSASKNSEIIACEAATLYDNAVLNKDVIETAENCKRKLIRGNIEGNGSIFFNNSDFSNMTIIAMDNNDQELKSNIKEADKALYIISEFSYITKNEYKKIPFLHDFWISFNMDRCYTGVYPNVAAGLNEKSKWAWKQYYNLMSGYLKITEKIKKNKVIWSPIHLSLKKAPLITAITPIISKGDGIIGATGTTLAVEKILNSIVEAPVVPSYGYGIINSDAKYRVLSKSFYFIINEKEELIAISNEGADFLGFNFLKDRETTFCRVHLNNTDNQLINSLMEMMMKNFSGAVTIPIRGEPYIFAFCEMKTGWRLCTVVSEYDLLSSVRYSSELVASVSNKISIQIIIITLVLLLISVIFSLLLFRKFLIKPLMNLCDKVKFIGKGSFDINFDEKGTVEIAKLASTFKYLSRELSNYAENLKDEIKQRQKIETEIRIAGDIQASMQPKIDDRYQTEHFSIAAQLSSAKEASGDFYDTFYLDKNRLVILIADVSGKGISAAFFMAITKFLIKSLFLQFNRTDPAEVLIFANNVLNKDNKLNMFVTVFLGIYNPENGEFIYSNAGHHAGILVNNKGVCSEFGIGEAMALGIWTDIKYLNNKIILKTEDTVVLYTDGVTEAVDDTDCQYGIIRLKKLLKETIKYSCGKVADSIIRCVRDFENGKRFDDITLVVFRRNK